MNMFYCWMLCRQSNWPQKNDARVLKESTNEKKNLFSKNHQDYNFLLNIFDASLAFFYFLECVSDFFYFSLHTFTVFEEKIRLFAEPKIIMWWKTREQRGTNFSNKQDFFLFLLLFFLFFFFWALCDLQTVIFIGSARIPEL